MFDKLTEIYYQHKWSVYSGGFLLLLLYAIFSTLAPAIGTIIQDYTAIRQNTMRVGQAENWATIIRQLKQENKQLLARLNASYIRAPQNDELSQVLALLSHTARETGIRFVTIQPQDAIDDPTYRILPIEIELEGTFHAIARFLNQLETSKKIIKMNRFELTTEDLLSTQILAKLEMGIYEIADFGLRNAD